MERGKGEEREKEGEKEREGEGSKARDGGGSEPGAGAGPGWAPCACLGEAAAEQRGQRISPCAERDRERELGGE